MDWDKAHKIAANWLQGEIDPYGAYEPEYFEARASELIGNIRMAETEVKRGQTHV